MNIRRHAQRFLKSYRKRTTPFLKIPGMVGYDERMNLYNLCKELKNPGHLLEFGALFGASTAAILAGMEKNSRHAEHQQLHVVDCFRTPSASAFGQDVLRLASSSSCASLLKEDGQWLDFSEIFLDSVSRSEMFSRLKVFPALLDEFTWDSGPVIFLHLDLPKDWSQLRLVFEKVFHELQIGAPVLFQDYIYHWSAELIGFVGILHKNNYIEIEGVVDTTLIVRSIKRFDIDDIAYISKMMGDRVCVLEGIDHAFGYTEPYLNDTQIAVMNLARFQYGYDPMESSLMLKKIGGAISENFSDSDFCRRLGEMMLSEFRLIRSFEIEESRVL